MKFTLRSASVFAAFVLVLTGCRSAGSTSVDIGPETGSDAAIEGRLEMLDPSTIGAGTARHVEVELHNTSGGRLVCLVTADWFDEQGQPVPLTARQWIRIDIDGGEKRKVRFDPMPSAAQSFRLRYAPAEKN